MNNIIGNLGGNISFAKETNFSLINNNSNENGEKNSLANLLNDISGNEIQKEKVTSLSKLHSKNCEGFLNHKIFNINSRLSNNSFGAL